MAEKDKSSSSKKRLTGRDRHEDSLVSKLAQALSKRPTPAGASASGPSCAAGAAEAASTGTAHAGQAQHAKQAVSHHAAPVAALSSPDTARNAPTLQSGGTPVSSLAGDEPRATSSPHKVLLGR